jgi:hypothetical protein
MQMYRVSYGRWVVGANIEVRDVVKVTDKMVDLGYTRQLKVKVNSHKWFGSFEDARNFALNIQLEAKRQLEVNLEKLNTQLASHDNYLS